MHAAVAAGAPATVDVAVEILRRGGNAVDAAVGAAFAMPVTEPGLASLGGGGFMMIRDADGHATLLDFFAAVPSLPATEMTLVTVEFAGARQDFEVGEGSVAVPGMLPGLRKAHSEHGRLPWRELLQIAQDRIARGCALAPAQALVLELIGAVLTLTPESADVFAPGGRLLRAGDVLRNPEYVAFLGELIQGRQTLPADGPLTAEDMAAYDVIERVPLRLELSDAVVLTNPPPSLGGSIIAHALSDLPPKPSALDLLMALRAATEHNKAQAPVSVRGTTHISVTDGSQTVAMTVSNGSNAGVMLPGTGVQLNNMMGESDLHPEGQVIVPGARIRSMMAPSLVEQGGVVTALGTGGSERIRSALTRVIADLVRGAGLQDAIDAPRIHLDNDGVVQVEPGFPADEMAELPAPVSRWRHKDFYFGGVHAVSSDGAAAADARRGGVAAVVH